MLPKGIEYHRFENNRLVFDAEHEDALHNFVKDILQLTMVKNIVRSRELYILYRGPSTTGKYAGEICKIWNTEGFRVKIIAGQFFEEPK